MNRQTLLITAAVLVGLACAAAVSRMRFEHVRSGWADAQAALDETRRMAQSVSSAGTSSTDPGQGRDILNRIRQTMASAGVPAGRLDSVVNRASGVGDPDGQQAEVSFTQIQPDELRAWHRVWKTSGGDWTIISCSVKLAGAKDASTTALQTTLLLARKR